MKRKSTTGFTLVELMVTLAVLAILAAIAVPNLREMVLSNALDSSASDLRAMLAKARQEAVTRNTTVTLSANSNSGSSPNISWSSDFTLFVNPMYSTSAPLAKTTWAQASSDTIGSGTDVLRATRLQVLDMGGGGAVSFVGADATHISFAADGRVTALNNQTFYLCVDPTTVSSNNARRVRISTAGRVLMERVTCTTCPTTCNVP